HGGAMRARQPGPGAVRGSGLPRPPRRVSPASDRRPAGRLERARAALRVCLIEPLAHDSADPLRDCAWNRASSRLKPPHGALVAIADRLRKAPDTEPCGSTGG